jgi:hypothetical protein
MHTSSSSQPYPHCINGTRLDRERGSFLIKDCQIKDDLALYKDKIGGLTETYLSPQDVSAYYLHHNVYKASDAFQMSIVKLFNKEGYNYF